MKNINYSIEDEKNYTQDQIKKILNQFNNINNLENILIETNSLFGCEDYKKVFKNAKFIAKKDYERLNFSDKNSPSDSLCNKYPQLGYANIFKKPLIYMPSLYGDLIIYNTFISTLTLLSTICYVKSGNLISLDKLFKLLNRVMILLDKFDQNLDFTNPSKDFFEKIKQIKWDNNAKKLYNKIQNIRNNITNVNSGNMEVYNTRFNLTENFLIIFLAASSAVNKNNININIDDVVISHKIYYKLLKMDYDKLINIIS